MIVLYCRLDDDSFTDMFEAVFEASLSDGVVMELFPLGTSVQVTLQNLVYYRHCVLMLRLTVCYLCGVVLECCCVELVVCSMFGVRMHGVMVMVQCCDMLLCYCAGVYASNECNEEGF